jgi:hypothetical protein
MTTTNAVLDRHLKSFADRDLDGILADYSSDAVLFVPTGPLKVQMRLGLSFKASFPGLRSGVLVYDAAAME